MHHCEDFEFPMRFEIGQERLLTQARGAKDVRALQRSLDCDSESSSDEERGGQHPFYQTIPSTVDAFPTVEFDLTQFDSLDDQWNSSTPSDKKSSFLFHEGEEVVKRQSIPFLPVDIPIDTPH